MPTTLLRIRKKGSLTLPVDLRNKYHLDAGNILTLIDLENGSFLLAPRISEVNQL